MRRATANATVSPCPSKKSANWFMDIPDKSVYSTYEDFEKLQSYRKEEEEAEDQNNKGVQ